METSAHTFLTEASLHFALHCPNDVSEVSLFCQELTEVMPGFAIGAGDVVLRAQTGGLFVGAVLAHTDLWP